MSAFELLWLTAVSAPLVTAIVLGYRRASRRRPRGGILRGPASCRWLEPLP